jgi:hypothetical protein
MGRDDNSWPDGVALELRPPHWLCGRKFGILRSVARHGLWIVPVRWQSRARVPRGLGCKTGSSPDLDQQTHTKRPRQQAPQHQRQDRQRSACRNRRHQEKGASGNDFQNGLSEKGRPARVAPQHEGGGRRTEQRQCPHHESDRVQPSKWKTRTVDSPGRSRYEQQRSSKQSP